MSSPWSKEWFEKCEVIYGKVKEGRYAHWCPYRQDLPIDETTHLFQTCECFKCKCGRYLVPKGYMWGRHPLEIQDDIFECPDSRFWNFWKHKEINFLMYERGREPKN